MQTVMFWAGAAGALTLCTTWIVYPGTIYLLTLVARPKRSEKQSLKRYPKVSVVLATRAEADVIGNRVDNLLDTEYPPDLLEIVVALDARSALAPSAVRETTSIQSLSRLTVCRGEEPGGKAATLNTGVAHSTGEILVFADSHQRFGRQTISALVSAFDDPRNGAVSGSFYLEASTNTHGLSLVRLYWHLERALRRRESLIHSAIGVTGAVWAARRTLWHELPDRLILDDVYTPMRLILEGHRVAFVEEAVAYETRSPTAQQEHVRKTRTLTGVIQLCAWLPEVLIPWKNPVFPQFVLHKLARLLTPYALLLVGLSGLYFLLTSLTREVLVPLGIVLASGLAWALSSNSRSADRLRAMVAEFLLYQMAVVKAVANGLRRRWDVWG